MSWSRRSVATLALSIACLILAVVFLLTRSNGGRPAELPYLGPPFIPTPTPVVYIESRFPWQPPITRPAPTYGPLPFVPPPGGGLKPPTEPPGPSARLTGAQIRSLYLGQLTHTL